MSVSFQAHEFKGNAKTCGKCHQIFNHRTESPGVNRTNFIHFLVRK